MTLKAGTSFTWPTFVPLFWSWIKKYKTIWELKLTNTISSFGNRIQAVENKLKALEIPPLEKEPLNLIDIIKGFFKKK